MKFNKENIIFDLKVNNKADLFEYVSELALNQNLITDKKMLVEAFLKREAEFSTGFNDGFAIPHAKSKDIKQATIFYAKLKAPINWPALDEHLTQYVFLLLIPDDAHNEHLKTLSLLATKLLENDFKQKITTLDQNQLYDYLVKTLTTPSANSLVDQKTSNQKSIVAVTACVAGIAHTYMAAKILETEFLKVGYAIKVEKQGAGGIEDELTQQEIDSADLVIMCVDTEPKNSNRFNNKKQLKYKVAYPLHKMDLILNQAKEMIETGTIVELVSPKKIGKWKTFAKRDLNNWKSALLTGISYMVPIIIAGGMFQAIMVLLQQIPAYHNLMATINTANNKDDMIWQYWYAYWPTQLGSNLLTWIMVPVLSAYMSYALAQKPGLAPGFAAGMCALITGSGFVGGMIGGIIAGYTMRWIKRFIKVGAAYQGFLNFWLYPTLGIIIVAVIMILGLGWPLAKLTKIIVQGMLQMPISARVGMGILVGTMVVFDLGGPINKAAYAFAIAAINEDSFLPYAIFASVKMVPCFSTTISTLLYPTGFDKEEKMIGKTTWIMGLAGITEPNIPFALKDPLRVIPAYIIGAAITGGGDGIFWNWIKHPGGRNYLNCFFNSK